jgi:hypothetical protein
MRYIQNSRARSNDSSSAGVIQSACAAVRIDQPVQQRTEQRVFHRLGLAHAALAAPVGRRIELDDDADGFGDRLCVAVQQVVVRGIILQRNDHCRRIGKLAGLRVGDGDHRLDAGVEISGAPNAAAQRRAILPELLDHERNVHSRPGFRMAVKYR